MALEHLKISTCPICKGLSTPLGITVLHNLTTINEKASLNYVACLPCGFVFQANPLKWESLALYYRNSPRYRSAEADSWDRLLCVNQLRFIEDAGQLKAASVLDIGADMGKMLDLLKEKHGCQTTFIEENDAARQYLNGHGRHKEARSLEETGRFDWCILSQVLEHIVQPVSFLEKLREHLTPGGNLFIEVPNHSFWDDHDFSFVFEHVNYFSPSSLARVLHQAGFIVTKLVITSDERYFHGKIRIMRVVATPMPVKVRDQLLVAVREHQSKEVEDRFRAAEALANKYAVGGKPGLALYGAAELADRLLAHTKLGPQKIAAIFDTDIRKHGQDFHGFRIAGADRESTKGVKAILMTSPAEMTIRDYLLERGYSGDIIGWSDLKKEVV